MFRNIIWRIILGLLLLVVIVAAGYGVYRLGYAQGYQAAALGVNGRAFIRPLPFFGFAPNGRIGPGIRFPFFFSFFVPFFWIGIGLLVFLFIRALVRPWGTRRPAVSEGPSAGYGPVTPGPTSPTPTDAGPYDPYHLRDQQDPLSGPGAAGPTQPIPPQP